LPSCLPTWVQRAENLSDSWMFRHPSGRARLAEALGAGKGAGVLRWLIFADCCRSCAFVV
jgi:hypothetical protein